MESEQRLASHILIATDAATDAEGQKAAQARAQAIVDKARAPGADFAALAREHSEDPGSRNAGGDLGWLERNMTDAAFESALFALEAGAISDPVKGDAGWHVIQLREIKPETGKPFEEARPELEREFQESERERLYNDRQGDLVDAILRNPASLEAAAHALSLTVQRSEPFTRAGGTGIAAHPKVIETAFSAAVLTGGTVSDPIEIAPGRSVAIRAVDHVPATPQAFESVQDQVRAGVVAERRARIARESAEARLAEIKAGTPLTEVAKAVGVEVQRAEAVGRMGATVPPAVSQRAFGLPHPAPESAEYAIAEVGNAEFAVIALTAVADGDVGKVPEETRRMLADQLGQAVGGVEAQAFVKALRQAAVVDVVESRL
jgi:peptidyl-prolyl cis-trans isomerase D